MRKNVLNILLFLTAASGFTFLFFYASKHWMPDKDPEAKKQEDEGKEKDKDKDKGKDPEEARKKREEELVSRLSAASIDAAARAIVAGARPVRLIALGDENCFNQVLLTTVGGGVQQVILPSFDAADRLGREVRDKGANGKPQAVPYHLIPGKQLYDGPALRAPYQVPELEPGVVAAGGLTEPSYTIFHYRNTEAKFPDPILGEMDWKVVAEEHPADGEHKVVFEAELGEPYFVTIRKTYSLAPKDYHFRLKVSVSKRVAAGSAKGAGQFRLQLSGPRMLPIEGEWYSTIYRVGIVGWTDKKGTPRRQYEDAATVAARRGGEAVERSDNTFKYMAVTTQYFASAVAIDDSVSGDEVVRDPWAWVRTTTEVPFDQKADLKHPFLEDLTIRAASDPIDLAPGQSITHAYVVYNGPTKVRLLGYLTGSKAVSEELVQRYREELGLQTMTDFRSETWLGRFASTIYWTDLVISFTNIMHWLLTSIHSVVPNWAMSIVVLTVMVRLLLFIPSRKQTQMNLRMMEVQKKLSPQIEELKKRHADDPQAFNREKMKLMMANGVNPFAMMGGCLLLIAQMPIMMGLYFCLQESVFFRLQSFLWIHNLAAPDMLIWWTEQIPFVSTPEDMGSFIYLGPFFNALPLLAVGLMIWQQKKMMPPPTDEQMAQQQKMMKYMMIMVAVMFYKVAAGLALYFIIGSAWGIIERRLIPKAGDKKKTEEGAGDAASGTVQTSAGEVATPKPKGLLGRMQEAVKKRMEEMQKQADENSKRQIRNDKGGSSDSNGRDNDRRDRKKRRRK